MLARALEAPHSGWRGRALQTLPLILCQAGLVLLGLALGLAGDEDANIYFRYALHVAHGQGLTFNLGIPVEGYSSPIWMAVLALAARLGVAPHVFARGASLLLGAAVLGALHWLVGELGGDRRARLGAVLSLCASFWFVAWSQSGLETTLYALVLLLAVGWTHRVLQNAAGASGGAWLAGSALAAAALSRPEGALVLGPVAVLAWRRRLPSGALLGLALPAAVVLVAHELWRHATFGAWAPNTSIKVYPLHFDRSLPQAAGFALSLGVLVLLLPGFRRSAGADRALGERWIWLTGLLLSFGFHLLAGGDYRPGFRYLMPALPLLLAAAWSAFPRLVQGRAPAAQRLAWAVLLGSVLLGASHDWLTYGGSLRSPRAALARWVSPVSDPSEWGVTVARWLLANAPRNAVVAYGQMGKAPYLMTLSGRDDVRFIDTVGWVDRDVARIYGLSEKLRDFVRAVSAGATPAQALLEGRDARARALVDLLLRERPDLILIEPHLQHYGVNVLLPADPRFLAAYEHVLEIPPLPAVAVYRRRSP